MIRELLEALEDYATLDRRAQTELLNDRFGSRLAAWGFGRVVVVGPQRLLLNVRGRLRQSPETIPGVRYGTGAVSLDGRHLPPDLDLAHIAAQYEPEGDGAYVWFIPDGYMARLSEVEQVWEREGGGYFSHESICVLNTAERATRCRLEVFFEESGRAPISVEFQVAAKQSLHYRLDKLKDAQGNPLIPKDTPVSYKITSFDTRVVVQGSRILTSGRSSEFASFGTAMAWTPS
ncbi:MAG: hypothetical protein KatS3mg115_1783 [Candidatus Poribacteria bacterium]|nr:MAG: hypothetical protein KatS3mg115_1783 [Candidatus Poribacteria bacterium]